MDAESDVNVYTSETVECIVPEAIANTVPMNRSVM